MHRRQRPSGRVVEFVPSEPLQHPVERCLAASEFLGCAGPEHHGDRGLGIAERVGKLRVGVRQRRTRGHLEFSAHRSVAITWAKVMALGVRSSWW